VHSFTTERLLIRPIAEQDKDTYLNLYTDVKIMRNISEPLTKITAEKAFNASLNLMQKEKMTTMTWAIVSQESHKCIGIQALNWQTTNSAEIGIMLLRDSNGKLIPEEAMGALMEYAFNYLSIKTILANYKKSNLATKRFVKKLGFSLLSSPPQKDTENYHECFSQTHWHKALIKKVYP